MKNIYHCIFIRITNKAAARTYWYLKCQLDAIIKIIILKLRGIAQSLQIDLFLPPHLDLTKHHTMNHIDDLSDTNST